MSCNLKHFNICKVTRMLLILGHIFFFKMGEYKVNVFWLLASTFFFFSYGEGEEFFGIVRSRQRKMASGRIALK
jgi:hypothetical protein